MAVFELFVQPLFWGLCRVMLWEGSGMSKRLKSKDCREGLPHFGCRFEGVELQELWIGVYRVAIRAPKSQCVRLGVPSSGTGLVLTACCLPGLPTRQKANMALGDGQGDDGKLPAVGASDATVQRSPAALFKNMWRQAFVGRIGQCQPRCDLVREMLLRSTAEGMGGSPTRLSLRSFSGRNVSNATSLTSRSASQQLEGSRAWASIQ